MRTRLLVAMLLGAALPAASQTRGTDCQEAISEVNNNAGDGIDRTPEKLVQSIVELRKQIEAGCPAYLTLGMALESQAHEDAPRRPQLLLEARAAFQRHTELFPDDAEGWYRYARSPADAEPVNSPNRLAALRRALQLRPKYTYARIDLGEALLLTDKEAGLTEFRRAYREARNTNEIYEEVSFASGQLMEVLRQLGREEEMQALAENADRRWRLLSQIREATRLIWDNCMACRNAKRAELERAIAMIEDALKQEPLVGPESWLDLGRGYYELGAGEWQPALSAAEKQKALASAADNLRLGIAEWPGGAEGVLYLGLGYAETGDRVNALANLRSGIDMVGLGDLNRYAQLATGALKRAGMLTEAETIRQQALRRGAYVP